MKLDTFIDIAMRSLNQKLAPHASVTIAVRLNRDGDVLSPDKETEAANIVINTITKSNQPEDLQPEINKVENSDGLTVALKELKSDIVWGVPKFNDSMFPILHTPSGEQRMVLAKKQPGKLYVKTATGVHCFILHFNATGQLYVKPETEQKAIYAFPEMEMP